MPGGTIRTLAVISANAVSLANFRGPLIAAMVASGLKVYALAPDFDDSSRAAVAALGAEPVDIRLERTGISPVRDVRDMLALARTLRRLRPDATFGYFVKPVIYGTIAAYVAGVPRRFALVAGMGYVFTHQEGERLGPKRRFLRSAVTHLYKLAFRLSERVFFHNADDVRELVAAGWLPEGKTVLLPGTGVDLRRFEPAPPPEGPVRFLLIARLLREKGIAEFAEAARLVKARYPDVEFHLVGGNDSNPGSIPREEVERWVAERLVDWRGHLDDVRPAIASSTVFVLPSYREGKPRSTQEAMAMGRAVITTDAVGCRDTVEDGINGFLVRPRDPAALADAMIRFIEQPALAATMGAASLRLAQQWFDVRKINARILDAISGRPLD